MKKMILIVASLALYGLFMAGCNSDSSSSESSAASSTNSAATQTATPSPTRTMVVNGEEVHY